ncbi:MAG: hypothetical protein ABEI98_01555 [Halorhabdus sp.]
MPVDGTKAAAGAAAGAAGGGVVEATTGGLSIAAARAGDVLRSIFGGQLPWNMTPGGIVDAVTSGLPEAVPKIAPLALEVLG